MTKNTSSGGTLEIDHMPGIHGDRKPAAKKKKKPAAPEGRGLLGRIVYWTAVVAVWGGIVVAGILFYLSLTLPDTSALWNAARAPALTIVADDGEMLAHRGQLFGGNVDARNLPPALVAAVLATEDKRFYDHFGLDPWGLARAIVTNIRAGAFVQGGSTLTQQLAKNVFLTPERTLKRKLQEMLLALWLEARFSKEEILSMYLNRVYFGGGAYGIEAASERFFNKPARDVTLPEAAMLAGLLKAPTRYAPTNDIERAQARAQIVVERMRVEGYIDQAEADRAIAHPAKLAGYSGTGSINYFVDWIADTVPSYANFPDADLTVTTTIDPGFQRIAETVISEALARDGEKLNVSQAALVAMTPDGAVKAMIGGRNYKQSQFNRAVQARRQPGSAFKPFVYLTAMDQGYTPDSIMVDRPLDIDGWTPTNYSPGYRGPMSLKTALADSVNTVAVQLAQDVGIRNVIATAKRLGLTGDPAPDLSVALGTWEVNLLELTAAYGAFANGGDGVIPYAIQKVGTPGGSTVYQRQGSGLGPAMDDKVLGEMNYMLAAVVDDGTGKRAKLGGRPVAGKTGTSQNFRDAWFIGYTADLVVGVWVGNDDGEPMDKVSGGTLPASIWKDFMTRTQGSVPVASLPGSYRRAPAPTRQPSTTVEVTERPEPAAVEETPAVARAEPVAEEPGFFGRLFGSGDNDNESDAAGTSDNARAAQERFDKFRKPGHR